MDSSSKKLVQLSDSIFRAVQRGSLMKIRDLLDRVDGATADKVLHWRREWLEDGVLYTPLTLAIHTHCGQITDFLLQHHKLDVNQTTAKPGDPGKSLWTNEPALWYAVKTNDLPLVRRLIETHKAEVSAVPDGSVSLMALACFMGHKDIVHHLLQLAKANPKMQQEDDNNGIVFAIVNNHFETVELLLKSGVSVGYNDTYGHSLLHVASYYGNDKTVEVLLKHGALATKVDAFQLTPMQLAAHKGHETTFNLLNTHLTKRGKLTREDSICALELMGASKGILSFEKDQMASCYGFLTKAMRQRYEAGESVMRKETLAPQERYDYKLEHATMEELHRLRGVRFTDGKEDTKPQYTAHPLIREAFIMKERVLGPENLHMAYELLRGVRLYGESLGSASLLCFLRRTLYILSQHHQDMNNLLSVLIQLVSIQAQLNIYSKDDTGAICYLKTILHKIGEFSEHEHFWHEYFKIQSLCTDTDNTNYRILECILSSVYWTRKHLRTQSSTWQEFRALVGTCIKLSIPGILNRTYVTAPLHMLYRYQWPKRLYSGDIYVPLTTLLLECGADPEMEDIHGKTATYYLHEARGISVEDKARCVQIFASSGAKHGLSQAINTLALW